MLVLTLINKLCPEKLPAFTGACLGEGADGECLEIIGEPTKVIKFGVQYENYDNNLISSYEQIQNVIDYIMLARPQAYVHVFEYGYLGTFQRESFPWRQPQNFILYYYVMEKLNKISEDEKKIFHSIISHGDTGINKIFSLNKIKKMLQGMSRGLDFDSKKVIMFCENIARVPITHMDIHTRNIMKDDSGNFKLIDLDRIKLENYNGK